jgi:hypothetical protein
MEFGLPLVQSLLSGLMCGDDALLGAPDRRVRIDEPALEPFTLGLRRTKSVEQSGFALSSGGGFRRLPLACVVGGPDLVLQTLVERLARAADLGKVVRELTVLVSEFLRERFRIGDPVMLGVPDRVMSMRELGFEAAPPGAFLSKRRLNLALPSGRGVSGMLRSRCARFEETHNCALVSELLIERSCCRPGIGHSHGEFGFALRVFFRGGDGVSEAILPRLLDRGDRLTRPVLGGFSRLFGLRQSSAQVVPFTNRV